MEVYNITEEMLDEYTGFHIDGEPVHDDFVFYDNINDVDIEDDDELDFEALMLRLVLHNM